MKTALPASLKGDILAYLAGDQIAYGRAFGHLPLREIMAARMRRIGTRWTLADRDDVWRKSRH